jgi:hypothetical protein
MISFINTMRKGNPQQNIMNLLQQRASEGNPLFINILNLAQTGNTKGIEDIVRNMAQERGLDFDREFNSFKRTFGL